MTHVKTALKNGETPDQNDGLNCPTAAERLESLLSHPNPDKEAVHDAAHALTADDLTAYGLNAYRMNLLSLFADRWPYEKIEAAAIQAAICKIWRGWEHHHHLARLKPQHGASQIKDFPAQAIKNVLAQGRGLLLTTFHQGHYRYLTSEVGRAGIPFCLALANDAFCDYAKTRNHSPDAAVWQYMTCVNVEEAGGSLTLARTLSKGGAVFAVLDGNTGMDGPRGTELRAVVDILGCKARVKTGAIKMAARFGTPIMALSAHEIDGARQFHPGPLIDPGRPLRGQDADEFVTRAIRDLYAHFTENILHYAHEWGGGDLFHQWRVPQKAIKRPLDDVQSSLDAALKQGQSITRNAGRIVETRKADEIVWIDAHTLQCFRIPDNMDGLAHRLSPDNQGIDQDWIDRHSPEDKARIRAFLHKFASIDAISVRRVEGAS